MSCSIRSNHDLILTCKCSSVSPFLTVRLVTGTRQGIMILIGSNVGLENNCFLVVWLMLLTWQACIMKDLYFINCFLAFNTWSLNCLHLVDILFCIFTTFVSWFITAVTFLLELLIVCKQYYGKRKSVKLEME